MTVYIQRESNFQFLSEFKLEIMYRIYPEISCYYISSKRVKRKFLSYIKF